MNNLNIIVLLIGLFQICGTIKIPPYFSQCSKSDPNVNMCITHNANGGLYAFVKGDKTYNIQNMLPILIPKISLQIDKNLKINIANTVISQLEGAKIKDAKIHLEQKSVELAMYVPRATLMGQYHLKGKVSVIPIDEMGPLNFTLLHNRIKYNFDYELMEKKELHYINITTSSMTYKSERAYFKLYNLFAEHEFLGDVINQSLNENWHATTEDISPAISDALCTITTSNLRGFFEKVPFEELFNE